MESKLTHQEFAGLVNTVFRVKLADDNQVDVELTEVSAVQLFPGQEQFSIIFRGPTNAFLGQGIRPFEHEQMGEFALFIVPISQDSKGYYYEAVFNRLSR